MMNIGKHHNSHNIDVSVTIFICYPESRAEDGRVIIIIAVYTEVVRRGVVDVGGELEQTVDGGRIHKLIAHQNRNVPDAEG
jgi:hypothetical protein